MTEETEVQEEVKAKKVTKRKAAKKEPKVVETKESDFDVFYKKVSAYKNRDYSPNKIVNRAKVAFGDKFDQEKYAAWRAKRQCDLKEKIEGVWLSQ